MRKLKKKRYQENKKKKWFEAAVNTFIYIQNLPPSVTTESLKDHFKNCGLIKPDPNTGEPKIKIYLNEKGEPKGDARICFEH